MIFHTGLLSLGFIQLYETSSLCCCLLIPPASQTISFRFLWGNRVGDGIRHSFVILCTYNECTVSHLIWRIEQESLIQICKPLLAGDVSKSPCLCMPKLCLELLSFFTTLSTTICFFSRLRTNPWVIPTTAFHIHSQTTEWRHIRVCFGSSIYIFMVWEPHCCSVQSAQVWIGVVRFLVRMQCFLVPNKKKVCSFVFIINICIAFGFT